MLSKLYPKETREINIILKSNSNITQQVQVCQNIDCVKPKYCNEYCWNFSNLNSNITTDAIRFLVPPTNTEIIPANLTTNNLKPNIQYVNLYYRFGQMNVSKILEPGPIQTWRFAVGNHMEEGVTGILDFLVKYPYINTAISFLGGLAIHRVHKPVSSRLKTKLKQRRDR